MDMDPGNTPPNTATSLGSRETCARVNENDTLDADEDATDGVVIDVTATNIPATNPMIAFSFELTYPADVNVTTKNVGLMIMSLPGSVLLDAGDAVPDSDGIFLATGVDTGPSPGSSESGSGVLAQMTLTTVPTAGTGIFPLTLGNAAHIDPNNDPQPPDALQGASIAINQACPLPPVDVELVSMSLVSTAPTVATGTIFNLQGVATGTNNGPNPADIRIEMSVAGPPDCTIGPSPNLTEDFPAVPATASRTSTQNWTANCSSPSTHVFTAAATVTVIGLADETSPLNNGPLNDGETVAVTGEADVKVTGVTVAAPPDAATGAPFPVSVAANLHNNGAVDPVNADTTLDLAMPPGCTRAPNNPQPVSDTPLPLSAPVQVQATWTVSCNTTGLKTFDGGASAVIDQLHTTDPNLANNSGQGQDTTDTSLAVADVKATSVVVAGPADAAVNTNFPVVVSTTVHNNGPFSPVNTDISLTLNLPADCFTPVTTIVFQDASLGPSIAAQLPDVTFFVGCTNHSFHNITATATIAIDDPLAGDPAPGNNTLTSNSLTTAVIRTVDFKVIGATAGTPAGANTGVPFDVTVDSILHNNGPDDGPAEVSVALSLPADCSTPVNPFVLNINLPTSVATPLPTQTFPVTCTAESFHDFGATISLAAPLHVVDTNGGNNLASSTISTVPVVGLADLKVTAVSFITPASGNAGVAFNVSASADLHNNGAFAPVDADAAITLSMPADCSTPDPNPALADNLSLGVSVTVPIPVVWSVTCTDKSSHSFTASASVAPDQLHVQDPAGANNSNISTPGVTPIFDLADGAITSATVLNPPGFIAGNTNVPITVRTVLHNNGPYGPATFSLSRSIVPPAGCTVAPPASSSHLLAVSVPVTVDAVWTINCAPGSYGFNFSHNLALNELHVTDPAATNNASVASMTVAVDSDGDAVADDVEVGCGSNPNNGNSIPERIDGVYAGQDDDLDAAIDELLPAGAAGFDCDRDGYSGSVEANVYAPSAQGDQDPCGTNASPPTVPPSPIGWPADLLGGGIPDSTGRVNVLDITSFLAPVRYFGTNTGSNPGDVRWDLVPGPGIFLTTINVADLSNLVIVSPPMLGGVRAYNGPLCPYAP
ncbi:MAG TPA: hypothetical protein VFP63_05560 [Dehalococcoidia bacterium]|nr:hypothetical protein [Dehalococcoidia bacterium]